MGCCILILCSNVVFLRSCCLYCYDGFMLGTGWQGALRQYDIEAGIVSHLTVNADASAQQFHHLVTDGHAQPVACSLSAAAALINAVEHRVVVENALLIFWFDALSGIVD